MRHMIRQQTLDIDVDSEALALALQPNIGDINRRRILPVIERVLDEFSAPDRRIRIARLDVDIGDLPIENLEQAAEDALYPALRRAVEQALRDASDESSPASRIQPEAMSQLELLEYYLLGGTLPFWASGEAFSADALVLELSRSDPAGLAAMLRRHAHDRRLLERIVIQMNVALLERLLHLLTPEHAALILAYMLDLHRVHRVEPLLSLHDDEFTQLLWILTLSYVLRDPGSHFNRKTFLRWLIEGVAAAGPLSYIDLVETLKRGLYETERHLSLASSLPAVLDELLQELSVERRTSSDGRVPGEASALTRSEPAQSPAQDLFRDSAISQLASLEQFLSHGTWPSFEPSQASRSVEARVLELLQDDPDGLRDLIRMLGRDSRVIRRLVDGPGEETLECILDLLDSEHAVMILAYMRDIRWVHRAAALVPLNADRFAKLLWIFVLTYVLGDPGSQFNRKSFVLSLMKDLSESEALNFADFSETFLRGLLAVETHLPSASSLPAIIREIVGDLDPPSADRADSADHGTDTRAALDRYLSSGQMPAGWIETTDKGASVRDMLLRAAAEEAASVTDILRRFVRRSGLAASTLVDRLLHNLTPNALLALLVPAYQTAITTLIERLSQEKWSGGSAPDVQRALWVVALEYLLGQSEDGLDLAAMRRHFGNAALARVDRASSPSAQSLNVVRDERPDKISPTAVPRFAFAHYEQAEIVRYYLQHGLLPWTALLLDANVNIERSFATLLRLSPAALRAIFTQERTDGRVVQRLAHALPEHVIIALLERLLPTPGADGSPFRSALATFSGQAEDRRVFLASVVAAVLDGRELDLEQLAGSASRQTAIRPILPADLSNAESHALKSVLAGRLRLGEAYLPGEPATVALLQALIAQFPDDARLFIQATNEQPELQAALLHQVSAATLQVMLGKIYLAEAKAMQEIVRSMMTLAPDHRPDTKQIREELWLKGVLHLASGRPLTADFFLRLLRSFFSQPLSDQVREALSDQVTVWRSSGALLAAQADAFDAAIAVARSDRSDGFARKQSSAGESSVSHMLRAAVFAFLRGDDSQRGAAGTADGFGSGSLSDETLVYALHHMFNNDAEAVADFVRQHAADRRRRERWIKILPVSALARFSYLIEPERHGALLAAAEILVAARRDVAPPGNGLATAHEQLWRLVFDLLMERTGIDRTVNQLVADFLRLNTTTEKEFRARLLEQADRMAHAAGHNQLIAVLDHERQHVSPEPEIAAARPPTKARGPLDDHQSRSVKQKSDQLRLKTAFSLVSEDDQASGEPIYIGNAGLVLASPFLPHLFQQLDLLEPDDRSRLHLRDRNAISCAVHLLQYIVDGRTSAPEPLLVLNKILCGVPTQVPIAREIALTDEERNLCEWLLRSMISNWKVIADTSIAGLRETFLQREGKLQRVDDGWKLRVQRKTVDVLVDQVPWSVSVLFHPWMPGPVHVSW